MRPIPQVLSEIQKSLAKVKTGFKETTMIEIWTPDGKIIGDAGRGVKITIPFKSFDGADAPIKKEKED